MSTHFAGSQDVRRRRRIASEADAAPLVRIDPHEESAPRTRRRVAVATDTSDAGTADEYTSPASDLSLADWIPDTNWRLSFTILAAFVAVAAGLTCGLYADDWAAQFGSELKSLFAPRTGSVSHLLSVGLLACSAALAVITGWVRSHSLKDFAGHYRIWWRAVALLSVSSFCAATGAHLVLASILVRRLHWQFWHAADLIWIGPAMIAGLLLSWSMQREMASCRGSLVCLQLSTIQALVMTLVRLELVPGLSRVGAWSASLVDAGGLLMHWLLFVSLLTHCSWVVHRNAEPCQRPRKPWRIPMPHFLLRWRAQHSTPLIRTAAGEAESTTPRATKSRSARRKPGSEAELPTLRDAATTDRSGATKTGAANAREIPSPAEPAAPVNRSQALPVPASATASSASKASSSATATAAAPTSTTSAPLPSSQPVRTSTNPEVAPNVGAVPGNRFQRDPVPAAPISFNNTSRSDRSDEEESEDSSAPGAEWEQSGLSRKQRRKLQQQQRRGAG